MLSALVFSAAQMTAVFWTGNELYSACIGDTESKLRCASYVAGVADGVAGAQMVAEPAPYRLCIPVNAVSRLQIMDVATKFLRDNPADRHRAAAVLVYRALVEAYPCTR